MQHRQQCRQHYRQGGALLALSGSTAASGGSTAAGDFEPSPGLCSTACSAASTAAICTLCCAPAAVPPPLAAVPPVRASLWHVTFNCRMEGQHRQLLQDVYEKKHRGLKMFIGVEVWTFFCLLDSMVAK